MKSKRGTIKIGIIILLVIIILGLIIYVKFPKQINNITNQENSGSKNNLPGNVITEKQELTESETSPENSCTTDEDCFCRNFNGAEFLEGKSSSSCCEEDDTRQGCSFRLNINDLERTPVEPNHCAKCFYD